METFRNRNQNNNQLEMKLSHNIFSFLNSDVIIIIIALNT